MGWVGRESRAKTPHDVAKLTASNGSRKLKPHVPKPPTPKPPPRYTCATRPTQTLGSLVSALPVALALRGKRAIPIGKQWAEVSATREKITGWVSLRISKDTITLHIHNHHNEGSINSAPAHLLASMALRGSPCHRPRLSGPAATAARRLLFHTRQPGSRQTE